MIASLPMYDTAATRDANDRLWNAIRKHLGHGPQHLERYADPHAQWLRPDLLLSQTCGLPYRTELLDKVRLVGTPDYGVAGCAAGYYRSSVVVRQDDTRQTLAEFNSAILARNDIRSQSGWAAIEVEAASCPAPFSFSQNVLDTGAHAASAQAVADGKADIAAIDAVTWALLTRDTDAAKGLRVLALTRPTPGLPLITSLFQDPAPLLAATRLAITALSASDREVLMLKGITQIPHRAYVNTPA